MLVQRCPKHPTYTGKNKPRKQKDGTVCEDCTILHVIATGRPYRRTIKVSLEEGSHYPRIKLD